jgi:hypothetical protein
MSDEVRNGAPYDLMLSFPDQNKDSLIYTFPEADELVTAVGTLALKHIKENIRKGNGRRIVFEIVATPPEEEAPHARPDPECTE